MTVLLGICDLSGKNIDEDMQFIFTSVLENNVNDKNLFKLNQKNLFCTSYDSGAYHTSGVKQDERAITIVTGEPIIDTSPNRTRKSDTCLLHDTLYKNNLQSLKESRGVFSGLSLNLKNQSLKTFTDKLGIRPIYYYFKDDFLVFSSILSCLEELPFLDLTEDFKGICETIAMGFPLSNRTQYKFIKLLKGGEYISVVNNDYCIRSYWNWAEHEELTDNVNLNELSKKLYDKFDDAVSLRVGLEENAIAFLSGGLDSRCVTAALKKQVKNIHTFNFATEESQDGVFAKLFSEQLKSIHHEIHMEALSFPNWSELLANAWGKVNSKTNKLLQPKYPQKVWSGDGGSVGLGFVYLNQDIISNMIDGDIKKAVSEFLSYNKINLSTHYISSKYQRESLKLVYESIFNEINNLNKFSSQRQFYLFLMFNDQHRHLFTHFETIGSHNTELILPFFDSEFIRLILSVPVEICLEHKFYIKWFDHFPEYVRKVPWQTYPGHEPCPIKSDIKLSYQWNNSSKKKKRDIIKIKTEARDVIKYIYLNQISNKYINKPLVLLAMFLQYFQLRDYSYVVKLVKTFSKYTLNKS